MFFQGCQWSTVGYTQSWSRAQGERSPTVTFDPQQPLWYDHNKPLYSPGDQKWSCYTKTRIHFQADFTLPGPSCQSHLSGCHHLYNAKADCWAWYYLGLTVMARKTALLRWAEHKWKCLFYMSKTTTTLPTSFLTRISGRTYWWQRPWQGPNKCCTQMLLGPAHVRSRRWHHRCCCRSTRRRRCSHVLCWPAPRR